MPCFCGGFRAKKQKQKCSFSFVCRKEKNKYRIRISEFSWLRIRLFNPQIRCQEKKRISRIGQIWWIFRMFIVYAQENSLLGKFLCYLPYVGPGFRPFSSAKPGNDAFLSKKAWSDPQSWSKSSFFKGLVARCHSFFYLPVPGTFVNTFIQYRTFICRIRWAPLYFSSMLSRSVESLKVYYEALFFLCFVWQSRDLPRFFYSVRRPVKNIVHIYLFCGRAIRSWLMSGWSWSNTTPVRPAWSRAG